MVTPTRGREGDSRTHLVFTVSFSLKREEELDSVGRKGQESGTSKTKSPEDQGPTCGRRGGPRVRKPESDLMWWLKGPRGHTSTI